jgi:hypothetical protein
MLTAFGPVGRWKLGSAAAAVDPDGSGGGAARRRLRRYENHYQRFRHHMWLLYQVLGG